MRVLLLVYAVFCVVVLDTFAQYIKHKKMNKRDLIEKIAGEHQITKKQANLIIDSLTSAVVTTLRKGGKVTLSGFGSFSVYTRLERNGRNPVTGGIMKIKAAKTVRFKSGKEFSELINKVK